MELQTAVGPKLAIPNSYTIADLLDESAKRYGSLPALRFKRDGRWQECTFTELRERVDELARGLVALGIEPGDRVCMLSDTRPEWTIADFAVVRAAATVVPIYPTNSPTECEWIVSNSNAKAVICENENQVAKIRAIRDRLPSLELIIGIESSLNDQSDVITFDDLKSEGESITGEELVQRIGQIQSADTFTIIYTSGTTGPPKGCVLSHGNYVSVVAMTDELNLIDSRDTIYLFLPLAHGFALLIQLVALKMGATLAYFGGNTGEIINEVAELKPTYLPSVPRIFEKVYSAATSKAESAGGLKAKIFWWSVGIGRRVSRLQRHGRRIGVWLQIRHHIANKLVLSKVRDLFGGRMRQAVTGAAPISADILEFFHACGIPVLEGYGMTETSTVSTVSLPTAFKIGTVGRPLPGVQINIADDHEIFIKGPNIFQGYYRDHEATREVLIDGWPHTGDLGRLDADGYLTITGRKKDIIITAGGKNITPANLENDLKQSRWISQAVMYGDRRPYPVALITLDEEEITKFASERGLSPDLAVLSRDDQVRALIQTELDRVNSNYAKVEQIKKFTILDHDLSQETGELTPTLKVKRNVVSKKYASLFDGMYS